MGFLVDTLKMRTHISCSGTGLGSRAKKETVTQSGLGLVGSNYTCWKVTTLDRFPLFCVFICC